MTMTGSIKDFLNQLNENQLQAVIHQGGPAVVLAGAGSGKTRVLTTHAAWLTQEQKISSDKILLITFTNKAAGEMAKRIQQLTGYQLPYSGTFHSFCARILRREGQALGYAPNFLIFDTSDQQSLLKQIYKERNINPKKFKLNTVKALISQAKNNLLDVDQYQLQAEDEFQQEVAKLYRTYQQHLLEQNAVDFDDLLFNVVTLFNHYPDTLSKYQQQFDHVLVDEYQDTNKAQYQLTKNLSLPQNNVYVVGDFAQSIYAWRGADYRNLFYLKQDFKNLAEYKLEQNYRSTQPILSAATELISNNTTHPILKLWTEQKTGEPIVVMETQSGEAEAEFVVNQINELRADYQYRDIVILYRTNAQSRAFEEFFIKSGIPYQIIGGFKFYERKEIKDLIAYLRLTVNDKDSVSQERVIKLGKRNFAEFHNWLTQIKQKQDINLNAPHELLTQILKKTNYLEKFDAKNTEDEERLENIRELLSVAAQFQDTTIFLENISLVQDEQMKDLPLGETANRISLMSLHSAKGLEFPVVFMVGLEEGLLPHSHSLFDKEQLEEERRLCYVGITRAQKKLYLSYATNRWLYGRDSQARPSRFLAQLPPTATIRKQFVDGFSQPTSINHDAANMNQKQTNKKYLLGFEMSETDLDALLNDELDIEDFLNK